MSDPARRATDKDRELAERTVHAITWNDIHGGIDNPKQVVDAFVAALTEQREQLLDDHRRIEREQFEAHVEQVDALRERAETAEGLVDNAIQRGDSLRAERDQVVRHLRERAEAAEAERDDCRSIVADYERIAVLEDYHRYMMPSGNAIVEPTNMRAVFDRIRELEAKIRSIEEPAKRPLHIEGCPYRPYADKVLDPEEEEAAPDCTCPEEHMANYWKACWVLEKSQREIQIRELEAHGRKVDALLMEALKHDPRECADRIRELQADGRRRVLSGWVPISPEVAGRTDGAQIVDGQWYAPAWGCDSLQHGIDAAIAAEETSDE